MDHNHRQVNPNNDDELATTTWYSYIGKVLFIDDMWNIQANKPILIVSLDHHHQQQQQTNMVKLLEKISISVVWQFDE
ncbi:hypothetical protein DERF_000164 [Dermatophagoides farinae]|uniref:Uncharacterized protein n=1 Tax=Dermatophagoides farinae TaxID=6954 RepID=A0A922LCA6_DERFA|nr:hypothetical protein DERF_000164 [Dermatophagoides farinae]